VTLTLCSDVAAADWITRSGLPWYQLVTFGPAGFDAYARLRLLPDPVRPGQSESDAEAEDWRIEQLPRLFAALAAHTTTAGDCYVGVWDGWGQAEPAPKVVVPHREFWLFRGPLTGIGADDQAAFVWPADRAWCFTHDVDPHWAGIGGSAELIHHLVADPRLDVVPADPAEQQPSYR
jgi:hypothetical protein